MSEYDPKSIPILDDIIDREKADDAELDTGKPEQASEDNLDLFNDDTDDDANDDSKQASPVTNEYELNIPETAEPEANNIDEPVVSELAADEFAADETIATDTIESALIDYKTESDSIEGNQSDEILADESRTQIPLQHQVLLEPVVNEIVKQLMPDLEQQLRFLVKQALADRLPEKLIKQLVSNDDSEKNTKI